MCDKTFANIITQQPLHNCTYYNRYFYTTELKIHFFNIVFTLNGMRRTETSLFYFFDYQPNTIGWSMHKSITYDQDQPATIKERVFASFTRPTSLGSFEQCCLSKDRRDVHDVGRERSAVMCSLHQLTCL